MKKLLAFLLVGGAFFCLKTATVQAATPSLSLSNTGEGDNVQVTVSGDASSSVIISFQKTDGTSRLQYLSNTNASGYYSASISTSEYGITPGSSVQVKVNNIQSAAVAWPYTVISGSGAITLSNTGLIMTVGSSNTITINNTGSNKVYLLNNSNPQVANINLSTSQATIFANTFGQTVATICVLGTTSNCASAYITVQNAGAKALTLSQSNLTIAYNQSSQISILNSTGLYSVLNNSNPSVIVTTIKDQTITLVASSNGGSATITVCSTDMSACGIINASVGSVSSTAITFNQTAPTLTVGQTLIVAITGGSNYNISSNSNSNVVNAFIASGALTLVGSGVGSSVVTVCASNGNCNSITVTVSYASNGGPITLSQSNLWLQVGQAVSVVISGGSAPYSFANDSSSASYFSTTLNTNILTLTGVKAGSASLSVCSAGGACTPLSVLVNGVSTNTQLTFGSNNLSLKVGATSDVTLYGTGSYYISSTNNQNVATFAVNGSKVTVNAISAGNANVSVCQSGGQCGIIYVAVTTSDVNNPIIFSSTNPAISVGQTSAVAVNGGTGSAYYISSNTNPLVIQVDLSDRNLVILGKMVGSSVVTVCSATNSCSSLAVTVNAVVNTSITTASTTSTTSTTTSNNTSSVASGNAVLDSITAEAGILFAGIPETLAKTVNSSRNDSLESTYAVKYINPLAKNISLSAGALNNLNYFVVYGTPNTLKLGAGERAGVLSSYLQAYGKLPVTAAEWSDLIKIGIGRWPSELSTKAEAQAKIEFAKVYNRAPNLSNNKDANAITVIAYGLRPTARNTNSEKSAILSFRYVYAHSPITPLAWNIVRAIAYSGTSR